MEGSRPVREGGHVQHQLYVIYQKAVLVVSHSQTRRWLALVASKGSLKELPSRLMQQVDHLQHQSDRADGPSDGPPHGGKRAKGLVNKTLEP